jgi:Ca2+-binding EF-hand superfamily protein
MDSLE